MKNVGGPAVRLVDEADATLAAVLLESLAVQLGGIAEACREGSGRDLRAVRTGRRPGGACRVRRVRPAAIRPVGGSCWAPAGEPQRQPANYYKFHGVRQFHGCYSVGDDELWGVVRRQKSAANTLRALRSIRARRPDGDWIYVILDNLSAHKVGLPRFSGHLP